MKVEIKRVLFFVVTIAVGIFFLVLAFRLAFRLAFMP